MGVIDILLWKLVKEVVSYNICFLRFFYDFVIWKDVR